MKRKGYDTRIVHYPYADIGNHLRGDGGEDDKERVRYHRGTGEMSRRVGFDVRDRERGLGEEWEQAITPR